MLKDEIKKTKPFDHVEEEAFLNVIRTADYLSRTTAEVLKPYKLSDAQYNILRILRGANCSLACQEVGSRMITREPDTTRLFDRLEARGLISRTRSTEDRRVVKTAITEAGKELLAKLDKPVVEAHKKQFSHMKPDQLRTLINLLELVRSK